MTTLYYDAFTSGLVPVKVLRIDTTDAGTRLKVKVTRGRKAYRKDEVLWDLPRSSVVVKSGRKGHHQLVKTASMDQLQESLNR